MNSGSLVTFIDFNRVVAGSITARQNGHNLKVKEKLWYPWEKKRPVVVGIEIPSANRFGVVNLKYYQHCDE